MGFIRNNIMSLASASARDAMEGESRQWMTVCSCGAEVSVWDRGGLRYKAKGEPLQRLPCANCGQKTWHRLVMREPEDVQT